MTPARSAAPRPHTQCAASDHGASGWANRRRAQPRHALASFLRRLDEFCLDGALYQDRQEAADPGVGEALGRVLEVVAHCSLGVVPLVDVLGPRRASSWASCALTASSILVSWEPTAPVRAMTFFLVLVVRGLGSGRIVWWAWTTATPKVGLEDECKVNNRSGCGDGAPVRGPSIR